MLQVVIRGSVPDLLLIFHQLSLSEHRFALQSQEEDLLEG